MLQIALSYTPIIEISLYHEYFADGIAQNLRLRPFIETSQFINKYRLSLQNSKQGIAIYADKINSLCFKELLKTNQHIQLPFVITQTDKHFDNITKPDKENAKLLYFNNTKGKLHKDKYVDKKDYFPIAAEELESYKNQIRQFKMADIGIISLTLDRKLQKQILAKLEGGSKETLQYSLSFTVPHTYWRYVFVSRKQDLTMELEIRCNRKNIPFESIVSANNEYDSPYIFQSKQPIPLNEKTPFKLELWNIKKNGSPAGGKIINQYLPVPHNITYLTNDKKDAISEVTLKI